MGWDSQSLLATSCLDLASRRSEKMPMSSVSRYSSTSRTQRIMMLSRSNTKLISTLIRIRSSRSRKILGLHWFLNHCGGLRNSSGDRIGTCSSPKCWSKGLFFLMIHRMFISRKRRSINRNTGPHPIKTGLPIPTSIAFLAATTTFSACCLWSRDDKSSKKWF